jgi:HAD superfamily hydrolase (TIGR01509 family)
MIAGLPYPCVVRAVFFDWGNTLSAWEFDPELFVEGHVRGLAALGPEAPGQEPFTDAFAARILPRLVGPGEDELDYGAEIGALLASLGVPADDEAVQRFVEAEHRVWRPTHRLEPAVVDLLDGLGGQGLRIGLVSNLFDAPELMRDLFDELGLLERLDAVALSGEVGKRKPHPAVFESALRQAGVAASETVMVGDRLREDVGGAQALGMTTVQALWFHRDESGAATPDLAAATPADVLAFVGTT